MRSLKIILITAILTAFVTITLCIIFFPRYIDHARSITANEGYDSYEAAWNHTIPRGEIRVILQDDSKIKKLTTFKEEAVLKSESEGYMILGYGKFFTDLEYTNSEGKKIRRIFHTAKFNNWNRVRYEEQTDGGFARYDNGIVTPVVYVDKLPNE